jgi:methionine synthase I (cobalamin-dependent)
MAISSFLTHLAERPLLADGAMGTMLYARGFDFSVCYDALNLSHPEVVLDIHRQYAAAGAEVLETNTFGANAVRLANWNLEGSVAAIAERGVALARQGAREAGRDAYIAGAVGPLGANLAPLGSLSADQAYAVFREQITALAEAGADLLIFETFSDLAEIAIALRAARDVCDLPIVALMTFNRDQRTLLGITPQQAAHALIAHRPALIGANCSTGPRGVLEVVQGMADVLAGDAEGPALAAVPNAGFPEARGARLFYPATPDYFADYARRFVQAGARLVGGCCGTTPAHIRAMRAALDALAQSAAKHVHAAVTRRAERQSPPSDDTRFPTTPGPGIGRRGIRGDGRGGAAQRRRHGRGGGDGADAEGSRRDRARHLRYADGAHAHDRAGRGVSRSGRRGHRDGLALPRARAKPAAHPG